jgi:hypothetical protein
VSVPVSVDSAFNVRLHGIQKRVDHGAQVAQVVLEVVDKAKTVRYNEYQCVPPVKKIVIYIINRRFKNLYMRL